MAVVDLVTGFLGAGKTTFIKKYSDFFTGQGVKVHIIENEFGGFPIDAQALAAQDCDVSQLSGGCMCCTGRTAFQNLLVQAAAAGYERILVEPSGIYDVNSFFSILQSEPVSSCCQIGNVITLADSQPETLLSPEARYLMFSQLIYTGCVVFSKTQLRQPGETEAALDDLQKLLADHGSCRLLREENCCITKPWDTLTRQDFRQISTCGYRMKEYAYQAMNHMSLFSTTMVGGKFDTTEHLQALLEELLNTDSLGKIYRIKGYLADRNKTWYEINGSPAGCFIRKANVRRGVLLIIGQDYDEKAIKERFRALCE